MSGTDTQLANLLYVINDLLRKPEKVRIRVRQSYPAHVWGKVGQEYETDILAVVVASGVNPDVMRVSEPTIYISGTGWGKVTVTPIRVKEIVNIRRLTRAGGQVLWSESTPATTAERKLALTDLLALTP
jgi:hypothetical protein